MSANVVAVMVAGMVSCAAMALTMLLQSSVKTSTQLVGPRPSEIENWPERVLSWRVPAGMSARSAAGAASCAGADSAPGDAAMS